MSSTSSSTLLLNRLAVNKIQTGMGMGSLKGMMRRKQQQHLAAAGQLLLFLGDHPAWRRS
jgi:hypothetical protein